MELPLETPITKKGMKKWDRNATFFHWPQNRKAPPFLLREAL